MKDIIPCPMCGEQPRLTFTPLPNGRLEAKVCCVPCEVSAAYNTFVGVSFSLDDINDYADSVIEQWNDLTKAINEGKSRARRKKGNAK